MKKESTSEKTKAATPATATATATGTGTAKGGTTPKSAAPVVLDKSFDGNYDFIFREKVVSRTDEFLNNGTLQPPVTVVAFKDGKGSLNIEFNLEGKTYKYSGSLTTMSNHTIDGDVFYYINGEKQSALKFSETKTNEKTLNGAYSYGTSSGSFSGVAQGGDGSSRYDGVYSLVFRAKAADTSVPITISKGRFQQSLGDGVDIKGVVVNNGSFNFLSSSGSSSSVSGGGNINSFGKVNGVFIAKTGNGFLSGFKTTGDGVTPQVEHTSDAPIASQTPPASSGAQEQNFALCSKPIKFDFSGGFIGGALGLITTLKNKDALYCEVQKCGGLFDSRFSFHTKKKIVLVSVIPW